MRLLPNFNMYFRLLSSVMLFACMVYVIQHIQANQSVAPNPLGEQPPCTCTPRESSYKQQHVTHSYLVRCIYFWGFIYLSSVQQVKRSLDIVLLQLADPLAHCDDCHPPLMLSLTGTIPSMLANLTHINYIDLQVGLNTR
jgi:hypothetical protein